VVEPSPVVDRLRVVSSQPWAGTAFRHMFAAYRPERENTYGARWNPRGVAAVYASLTAAGALAEAEHRISLQPVRPRARRTLYELRVALVSVLDLTDPSLLQELGVGPRDLRSDDLAACQAVGSAANAGGHDGILVPSARSDAINLVILTANAAPFPPFEIVGHRVLGL